MTTMEILNYVTMCVGFVLWFFVGYRTGKYSRDYENRRTR